MNFPTLTLLNSGNAYSRGGLVGTGTSDQPLDQRQLTSGSWPSATERLSAGRPAPECCIWNVDADVTGRGSTKSPPPSKCSLGDRSQWPAAKQTELHRCPLALRALLLG